MTKKWMYRGNRRFSRKQIMFVAEAIMTSCLEAFESCGPTIVDLEDRQEAAGSRRVGFWVDYERGSYDTAVGALSIFYAQLIRDGVSSEDAALAADDFGHKMATFVNDNWHDDGEKVKESMKSGSWIASEIHASWPDVHRCAKIFADNVIASLGEAFDNCGR